MSNFYFVSKHEKFFCEIFNVLLLATNYKDTGLSGLYFVTQPQVAGKLAELACQEWQRMANILVEEEELQRAKMSLYTSMLLMLDGTTPICEDIGRQIMCFGRRLTTQELKKRIDVGFIFAIL